MVSPDEEMVSLTGSNQREVLVSNLKTVITAKINTLVDTLDRLERERHEAVTLAVRELKGMGVDVELGVHEEDPYDYYTLRDELVDIRSRLPE